MRVPELPPEQVSDLRTSDPRLLFGVSVLAALLTLFTPEPPGHRFPALFEAGKIATMLGALFLSTSPLWRARARPLLAFAMVLLALGVSALVARHTHDFRLFATVHTGLMGAAPELALVVFSAGLMVFLRSPGRGASPLPLALGLALTLALCLAPDVVFGEATYLVPEALGRGLTAPLAILIPLSAALALTLWVRRRRRLAPDSVLGLIPAALLVAMLVPAIASQTPLLGLAVVSALAALHLHAVAFLSESVAPPVRSLHRTAVVVVVVLWLLLKSQALIASNTDENIYFYMAKILAEGQWPYADYFFAHPPLHVVLPGLFFAVFGFSLTLAKLLPVAFCLIGGLALHATLARHLSRSTALLALILYLFAAEVLKASSNMTGVNMTTMFILLGTWQALSPRPFVSGFLLGLAPATGFYAMAPVLAVLAMSLFRRPDTLNPIGNGLPDASFRGRWARLLMRLRQLRLAQPLAFVLTLGGINLIFWSIGGDTFLEGVYSYHQQKAFQDPQMVELFGSSPGFPLSIVHNLGLMIGGEPFTKEVFYHPHLWLGLVLVPLMALATALATAAPWDMLRTNLRPSRLFTSSTGHAVFLWFMAVALWVQFAMFRELYSFYFALIYPFLAAGTAWVIHRAWTLIADRFVVPLGGFRALVTLVPVGALTLLLGHPAVSLQTGVVFEDEYENTNARNPYEWTPAPVLDDLSPIVRNLFWEDFRFKADVEPGYRHYLWSKKRGFTRLDEVAAAVARMARPDETIAGSSTLAPLIAVLADRRIAANEIDTNNKRFKTGLLAENTYWDAACADRLKVVISAPRSYFTFDKVQNLPIISRYFGQPTIIEDPTLNYRSSFPIALFPRGEALCTWIGPTRGTRSPATQGTETSPE